MDSARWERIQALFHEAADLAEAERSAYLDGACREDQTLRTEVLALLAEDARAGSLLDRGVAQAVHEMLDQRLSPVRSARFGAYRIQRVLGEGGMGVVYFAERTDLGSVAAIKILRDAWLSTARRERFAIEQRTLAQLRHPFIACLYDADTLADGTPWFAMEYVEGLPLTEYCRARHATMDERLRLFRDVCEAVQHAHRHAIIHRDLKPSNILVTTDGTVKLLDFGIAKHIEESDLSTDQTRTGLRLLTPAYAAPEQFRSGRIGTHTDIYSLGVVLFELLTDRLPFDLANCTPGEAEMIITERDAPRPSVISRRNGDGEGARLPVASRSAWADLDVLCLTAMQKDPQRRYRTVEALLRDVDHYLRGEPLDARAEGMSYRLGKFIRRNRRPVALASAVFLAIIGLVAFYTIRLTSARNAALAAAARTQRIQGFVVELFQGGDEAVGPADSLRVVTMVDRGVQEARALDATPRIQADLYFTLGTIYQQLGKFERADTLLRTALAQRRRLLGPNDPDVASSLAALGLLRDAQAQYDTAEALVRQALAIDERALPARDPALAKTIETLGQVLEDRGRYDQAISTLERAAELQSGPGGNTADLAETLTELANSDFYAGHFAASDSLNRRVLAMDRARYGARHPHVADDLINLGAIQFEAGHFAAAERYDRQALAIIRAWYGDDHPETASALTLLGRALVSERRYAEASTMLHQALTIQEHAYGPVHPRVASALNELGRVAQLRGDLDEAQADFTRMVAIYRAVYHDKHYLIGIALSNLASVYEARKQYAMADSLFQDVMRRYAAVLSPDHQLVGIARVRWGHSLLLEHRPADAEAQLTAGYAILMKQPSPPAAWVHDARQDLVQVYDALGRPADAARYRALLAR